ncbi:hypothetical protein GS439_23750 [Rhodococcus hoagii]|nr:hypothetical protein [Prescottella equi]
MIDRPARPAAAVNARLPTGVVGEGADVFGATVVAGAGVVVIAGVVVVVAVASSECPGGVALTVVVGAAVVVAAAAVVVVVGAASRSHLVRPIGRRCRRGGRADDDQGPDSGQGQTEASRHRVAPHGYCSDPDGRRFRTTR